ncbi:hypothetical protein CEXT_728671 [Caerostris extrusa]|uniref:Uncharacterized protein n=1 Tax=Caerostris extrusa TaxID=172846 RepID=A0AAV4Y6F3_CAEEX|nr:hypothetical protein CEXT_728671 [Caerostris extrusa]
MQLTTARGELSDGMQCPSSIGGEINQWKDRARSHQPVREGRRRVWQKGGINCAEMRSFKLLNNKSIGFQPKVNDDLFAKRR